MSISYICGWETGSLNGEPSNSTASTVTTAGPVFVGACSYETVIVRTGSGSLKVSPASGAAAYWEITSVAASAGTYIRFYVRITSLPTTGRMLFGDIAHYNVFLNTDGSIAFRNITTVLGTSIVKLTDISKWYRLELKFVDNSQELKLDGIVVAADTTFPMPSNKMRFGTEDTVAATYTAYFDDFVRDSSQYPGIGQERLLVPISDNARSTEWTGGVGGTTNLWNAVDNRPPIGTASETDLTQIEHAGGATGSYDANMTAYSDVGITSIATINGVQAFVWTGEDSATGDKLLSYSILSNPATPDSGSFNVASVSSALGTWPTNWWVTTSPAGGRPNTLNSPIMRVTRPETATRVASVCFMGIYVDYTPSTVVPPGSESDFIPAKSSQIVSVNRASFY